MKMNLSQYYIRQHLELPVDAIDLLERRLERPRQEVDDVDQGPLIEAFLRVDVEPELAHQCHARDRRVDQPEDACPNFRLAILEGRQPRGSESPEQLRLQCRPGIDVTTRRSLDGFAGKRR